MDTSSMTAILQHQRDYFRSGITMDPDFRIIQLKQLRKAILDYEDKIYKAFRSDFGKAEFEVFETEIGLTLDEISRHISHLKSWARPRKVRTNQLLHFSSSSHVLMEPYGLVLIISPWNYPFLLLFHPLVGAISAGNVSALKPSEFTPAVAGVMEEMVREYFDPKFISFHTGGIETGKALLQEKWDFIFFSGSPAVGRIVMEAASRHLTPLILELGGKSPCIVDADANLKVAAKRIVWGKFLNAGQTCIAPDYLFVHASVKDELLGYMKEAIHSFYGERPRESKDFAKIVNESKTQRLARFLEKGTIVAGGETDIREHYFAPTIIDGISPADPVMQEEIFGPILPVMEFNQLEEVIDYVNDNPKPLALYYFSENRARQQEVLKRTSAGGCCINDVLTHIANPNLPFGGVGNSGTGRYHGRFSFESFSNPKSVLRKSAAVDIPVRYPPYARKLWILKLLLK